MGKSFGEAELNTQLFADSNAWAGGYYELKIWLGDPSDERIREAMASLWESPMLEGPFDRDDKTSLRRVPSVGDHLSGLARIRGESLPLSTFVVREEDLDGKRTADFLFVGLPLGGLGTIYPVGAYPFADLEAAPVWQPEIDAWFLQLLRSLQRPFTFQLAVIGFEVPADPRELACDAAPGEDFYGIVRPQQDGLQWNPPASYES